MLSFAKQLSIATCSRARSPAHMDLDCSKRCTATIGCWSGLNPHAEILDFKIVLDTVLGSLAAVSALLYSTEGRYFGGN